MSRRLLFLCNGPKRMTAARLDERFAALGFDVDMRWAYGGKLRGCSCPAARMAPTCSGAQS